MPVQKGLQRLMNSRRVGELAFALCRPLPPRLGYPLARWIARRIAASRQTPFVRAIRSNQWVAGGSRSEPVELDQAVEDCLGYLTTAFYQLFHYWHSPLALQNLLEFSSEVNEIIARSQEKRHGIVVATLHTSGFDLMVQAAAYAGFSAVGLTVPDANAAVEWQESLRRGAGLEILPPTMANIRRVINRLSAGETAFTGIDRPLPDVKYHPNFFGRPTSLPTHHIFMALRAHVPFVLMTPVLTPDRRYRVISSGEIHMQPDADHQKEMVSNAERVLEVAEDMICKAPRQWSMPHPVWPEAIAVMP